MNALRRKILGLSAGVLAAAALLGLSAPDARAQGEPLRVAMGDIASAESLPLLVAMERTKERGVPMELSFFNAEDVAAQAVLSGEADIGVGVPYAFIANSGAPVRMFFRMSKLLFIPVVNGELYQSWADLDGQDVAVHSRGSGSEALMRLMEKTHGIRFANISYVPGSEVRAGAMLNGTINATVVDAAAFRLLEREGGGKFIQLPMDGVNATDEALYANTEVLASRADDMKVFVEELLRTWAEMNENPEMLIEARARYGLLPDLPDEEVEEAIEEFGDGVANGVYPTDGGRPEDAIDDIAFLAAAGEFEGETENVDPAAYWDLSLVRAVTGQ